MLSTRKRDEPKNFSAVALKQARERGMREGGLEPPNLAAPDPKSGVSANSTTPAKGCKIDVQVSSVRALAPWGTSAFAGRLSIFLRFSITVIVSYL